MAAEQPNPIDYLQGRTERCYQPGCNRRLQGSSDVQCYLCRYSQTHPCYKEDFVATKNAATKDWYFVWTFPPFEWESKSTTIVCKCCEAKLPALEFGEFINGDYCPFIAHCPLTKSCKAAVAYWGKETDEPLVALKLFKAQRSAAAAASVCEEPDEPEAEGNFDDEDFIDLRRSKPISFKV